MKIGATLPPCDWKTKDAFANMDIAGYNYGLFRYRHDLKKYPQRLILGTETFCKDAYSFWEIAKKNKRNLYDRSSGDDPNKKGKKKTSSSGGRLGCDTASCKCCVGVFQGAFTCRCMADPETAVCKSTGRRNF